MKKTLEVRHSCYVVDDVDMSLGAIKRRLDALIAEHGEAARLDTDSGYSNVSYELVTTRLETDEEYSARTESERIAQDKQRERDLKKARQLAERHGAKIV